MCIRDRSATVIHAGLLIDGESSVPLPEMSIIIEGTKIQAIEAGFITPDSEDEYIDLVGYTVLPGLMDMHVHLSSEYSKKSFQEKITLNAGDYAIRAVANAEKTLLAGFTTVRNLGDSDGVTISLRNAIKKGIVLGPRIFSSGTPRVRSVVIGDGPTQFTVIPNGANSFAITCVRLSTAALEATYIASPSNFIGRATDDRLTMRPHLFFCISFAASRQNKKVPTALVSNTRRAETTVVVMTWFIDAIPALLMSTSRDCLLYTSPSPRDLSTARMPSSA